MIPLITQYTEELAEICRRHHVKAPRSLRLRNRRRLRPRKKTRTRASMRTTDPIQILISWANRQPHWVREIVSIVLDHRRRLNATELSTVFDHCMVETEMAEGDISVVPNLLPPPSDHEPEERLELTALSFVENGNLLARNQVIQFNPHMTVIYGENATGKSGYVPNTQAVSSC